MNTSYLAIHREWVLFDLDSTLCDTRHRLKHGIIKEGDQRYKTDWVAYSMLCSEDAPIEANLELGRMLSKRFNIGILSGRSHEAKELTELWLNVYEFPYQHLILRDYRQSPLRNELFKQREVLEMQSRGWRVRLVVDDWRPVQIAMAKIGVPCLIVEPPGNDEAMVAHERDMEEHPNDKGWDTFAGRPQL